MSLKNLSATIKIPKLFKDKLKNNRINQIYNRFEKSFNINENFGVAVSGGPDSLALAFLAKIYSIKRKLIPKFFIVDHKLRSESTKEAKVVKNLLKRRQTDVRKKFRRKTLNFLNFQFYNHQLIFLIYQYLLRQQKHC